MGVLDDVERFVEGHSSCGGVTVESPASSEPVGFFVSLVCRCGQMLDRWVSLEAALEDLLYNWITSH
jgi:hypothetical protein